MEAYSQDQLAYRLLAGRILATIVPPLDPTVTASSSSSQPLKFMGSPADYSNQVFGNSASSSNNHHNSSYNNSGNSSSGLLHLNNSHDSSTSVGNSPASGTDHSGSFSAGTPSLLNTSGQGRSISNSGMMFSSAASPVNDLLHTSAPTTGGSKRTGKQGSGAQCPECDKRFNNSSALAKHKLIHSVERRYSCPKCGKGFKRQDHLSGHMMTHEEQKPYKCYMEGCDKSYCDSRSLRRHLENHHGVHVESPFMCPPDFPVRASAASSSKPDGSTSSFFSYEEDRIRQLAELNNSQQNTLNRMPDCVGGRPQHFSPITPAPASPSRRGLPAQQQSISVSGESRPSIAIVQCSICSKKFRSLASLNGHMRIHGPRRTTVTGGSVRSDMQDEGRPGSVANSRPPSPPSMSRFAVDGILGAEKHPLQSTSSCVFTPGPMSAMTPHPLSVPTTMRTQQPQQQPLQNAEVFMQSQQQAPTAFRTSSVASEHPMARQSVPTPVPPIAHQQQPPQGQNAPLDLAFGGNNSIQSQGVIDYNSRMPSAYSQSSNQQVNPSNADNQTASLALAMMKAALPNPFSVDRLNTSGVDPSSAWFSTLYSTNPSSFMAQMYQQQQQPVNQNPVSTALPISTATGMMSGIGSYVQGQSQMKQFTVPQSPGSFLRSRLGVQPPMPPSFSSTSWTPFPNGGVRQPPPQMKDIGTSPFVTIPKERQVFFPPDGDDQTSGCLSTQPQCSPSTPGTISVVGDHPPLSAGPLSAGYISVVGTPPQRSPAIMFGTPGSSSHSGGGANSSGGGSDTMPPCRMMSSTTPCPPSPIAINTNNKGNIQPSTMGLLMPAPSPQKQPQSGNLPHRMLPPMELPPPPPHFRNRPKFFTIHENDENNHHHHHHHASPQVANHPSDKDQCDQLSDLDSSPELFDQSDFDPHIYLRSPPQTAPPVLFAGGSEIDAKKIRHFSFDDCDVDAVKHRGDADREFELRTPSPVPDDPTRTQGPLPSPGVFISPPPFFSRKPANEPTPIKQEPTALHITISAPPTLTPASSSTSSDSAVKMETSTHPQSTSSVSSETSASVAGRKRPRPPPLPLLDSNFGPVSQLRSHIDAAIGSANSSLQSAGTVSSAASTVSSFGGPTLTTTAAPAAKVASLPANLISKVADGTFIPPYTPPPILSPFRLTPGTFWALKQLDSASNLASSSASSVFFSQSLNSNADTPLSDRRPRINVGSNFQAEIPPYRKPSLAMREADKDDLIFNPNCLANISDDQMQALCDLARSSAAGSPHGSNIELVMHLLSATQGSIEKVTLLLLNGCSNQELPPAVASYRYQENVVWTAEEIRSFISVVGQLKKDFHQIANAMKTKSVKECIEFYYLWKRLFSELTTPGEPPAKRQCVQQASSTESTSRTGGANGRVALSNEHVSRQNIHTCDFCPKIFDKKRAKSFHMKVYHPTVSTCPAADSVAASLLAQATGKTTSTCCQLVFAPSSNVAQVAQ